MVGKGLRFYSEGFNSCESELGEGSWGDMEEAAFKRVLKE